MITARIPAALLTAAITLLLFTGSVFAQISESEYSARRDALAAELGEGTLIAFGAPNYVSHAFSFSQLPSFNYLTGFHQPDAVLIMRMLDGASEATLYVDPPGIRTQLYDGFPEDAASIETRTGMYVRPVSDLRPTVDSLVSAGRPVFKIGDFRTDDYASRDTLTAGRYFLLDLQKRHPDVVVRDAYPNVVRMRARKSPAEVELLRRAVALTADAHRAALQVIKPGMFEYEVEAVIESTFRAGGGTGPSFSSIVGSGPNSTTLHYSDNDRRMQDGDVVVMDIGAEYAGYAGDITRTVPVSGTFTPEQREIYELVLESQKAAERLAGPGRLAARSLRASMDVRLAGLARLGLIESEEARFDPPWPVNCDRRPDQCLQGTLFMIHGISHGIGLEVHDPARFYFDGRYAPGDVFTIEPGIYVNSRALDILPDTPRNRSFIASVRDAVNRYDQIGVRIEDDYLVTDDGLVRLSADAPREISEIESGMEASGRDD